MSLFQPDIVVKTRQRLMEPGVPEFEREVLQELLGLIEQQAAELNAIKHISLNLTTHLSLAEVLDTVVREAMRLVRNATDAHIFLYQDSTLSFGAAIDEDGQTTMKYSKLRPEGLTYTVAREKRTIIVEDMRNHLLYANAPKDWEGSIIGMPLKMGERVVGVMNLARRFAGPFSGAELRLLHLLADHAAIAIVNARLHEAVSHQAYTDILTGLPNRRALEERLEIETQRARRYNHQFAVMMMDLDGFKSINDTYGHETGDMVLQRSFGLLAKNLRTSDFLARYGGDELTMILPETDLSAAIQAAQKLQEKMTENPIAMPDGTARTLGISGGIAIFPVHARQPADILRMADSALYRAKKSQRGTFMVARGPTSELKQ